MCRGNLLLPVATMLSTILLAACDAGTDIGPCSSECADLAVEASVVRRIRHDSSGSHQLDHAHVNQYLAYTTRFPPDVRAPADAMINGVEMVRDYVGGGGFRLSRTAESSGYFLNAPGAMNVFDVPAGPLSHALHDSIETLQLDAALTGITPGDTLHLDSDLVVSLSRPVSYDLTLQLFLRTDTEEDGQPLGIVWAARMEDGPELHVPVVELALSFEPSGFAEGPAWLRVSRQIQSVRTSPSGRKYTISSMILEETSVVIAP